MRHTRFIILSRLSLLMACAAPAFRLTDDSAIDRLMTTRHVAELQRQNPMPLTCWAEGAHADARELYLGENHPDHTVRIGAYRVTADGRVWMNGAATRPEHRWIAIK
jgi:hypothetical protein